MERSDGVIEGLEDVLGSEGVEDSESLVEFAITFANLAIPSTAARVAVNIRFFQRNGLDRTTAIGVAGLDSVGEFVAQISLMLAIVGFGLGSLSKDISANAPDVNEQLILLVAVTIVVGIAVVAFVPKFCDPVVAVATTTWGKIGPLLKSPRRLISVILANLLVQLLFSLAMYTVLRALGQDVGFADVVLVNEAVALFAGLMPVPGGVGVTEAALAAGFGAIGVDSSTAMAAAMAYRMITFYAPPGGSYPLWSRVKPRGKGPHARKPGARIALTLRGIRREPPRSIGPTRSQRMSPPAGAGVWAVPRASRSRPQG